MPNLLKPPIQSFSAAADGAHGTGARVRAQPLEGDPVEGELLSFDTTAGKLAVRPDGSEQGLEFGFQDLRSLRFAQDLAPALPPAGEITLFHIAFGDGSLLEGVCRDVLVDADGLHLLVENDGGAVHRLFVPLASVRRYRIGELTGHGRARLRPGATPPVVENSEQLALLMTSGMAFHGHALAEGIAPRPDEGELSPETLAKRLGVPFVKLGRFDVDEHLLSLVPADFALEHKVLPLVLVNERLVVAMANPADAELLSMLHFVSGHPVEGCVADPAELADVVDRYYNRPGAADSMEELETVAEQELEAQLPVQEVERLGKEKPIVRLVDNILREAIRREASDIHLRPGEKKVELLYRQDGTLVHVRDFNKLLLPALVARIKILGRMNIAERRLPQDGRARMIESGAVVDMRISVIPTVEGESVVIRLLNAEAGLRSISELGFNPRDAELFTDLLHRSYGLILVTGPTGSGKSTTLYAALQEVKKQNVNIITIEDPVEYHIEGIEQIQVNTAPGFTFARALRNILRHDPDVVMVGEIRDQETAKIAVESALTGHVVLSTLHTNDAPTTVTRLIEMGVEAFLVKSSLLGVLAQRLVRLNCAHCKTEEPVDETIRRFLGVPAEEVFYHGAGCEHCHGTGFHGRMAVYELLLMSHAMRDILRQDVAADEIRQLAIEEGMVPLTQRALEVAREGRISLAEVYRVRLE